jgi:predicted dehydrogenase
MQRDSKRNTDIGRRGFLTAAAAASVTFVSARAVRGADANSAIEIGLIGCGGRGSWIADLFTKHGGYKLVAGADCFDTKAAAFGKRFKVEDNRCYTGLSAYKRMLDSKVDAVIIESPPYFHPEQAAAAVDAGKHVYVAKPIAVDVPGCTSIASSGKRASEKKLVFLVDFQTRANPFYQEAIKRVHAGDIGKLVNGEAVYYCGPLGNAAFDHNNAEARLRNWSSDRVLSGDVITEQNIHALDVATWIIDENPLEAYGKCGKKARGESVTCNSYWSIVFTFPNETLLSFCSKQCGDGFSDIGCRIFGASGTIDTHYGGEVSIRGKTPYKGGNTGPIYVDGASNNIATFHDSIKNAKYENPTVAPSVRSNLTTIVGRTAAYERGVVSWDSVMKANEKLEFDTKGIKD